MKHTRGGQPGNRNALKHGLYSRFLSHKEILALKKAESLQGLDSEIAILRLNISRLIERDPDNLDLELRAKTALARLVRVQRQLSPRHVDGLQQSVCDALRELALPMGLDLSHFLHSPSGVENSPANVEGQSVEPQLQHSSHEK